MNSEDQSKILFKQKEENFSKYQSGLGEIATKVVLERLFNLELKKIQERKNQRTPDYEICDEQRNLIAVCEVKSCVDINYDTNISLDKTLEQLAQISLERDKNHRSKIEKHNSKALSQFDLYPSLPKLIVFVSFDMTDHIDMDRVLQNEQFLYPEKPLSDAYLLMKIHQKILPSDNFEIKQAIQLRDNSSIGKKLLKEHFSLSLALNNAGTLPITFTLEKTVSEELIKNSLLSK